MNKMARHINNLVRMSTTRGLMKSCRWLRIRNLVKLQLLNMMRKVIWQDVPRSINLKMIINDVMALSTEEPRLIITQQSFRWRTTKHWNQLPIEIREIQSFPKFKLAVRKWLSKSQHQSIEWTPQNTDNSHQDIVNMIMKAEKDKSPGCSHTPELVIRMQSQYRR